MRLQLAIAATRPRFLTTSLLPVLVGTAWGWRLAGRLDLPSLALALVATLLVHAASNVYNDVSDEELGTDRANTTRIPPFTGGSRYIQDGLVSLPEMRRLAGILAVLAAGAGCSRGCWMRRPSCWPFRSAAGSSPSSWVTLAIHAIGSLWLLAAVILPGAGGQ